VTKTEKTPSAVVRLDAPVGKTKPLKNLAALDRLFVK